MNVVVKADDDKRASRLEKAGPRSLFCRGVRSVVPSNSKGASSFDSRTDVADLDWETTGARRRCKRHQIVLVIAFKVSARCPPRLYRISLRRRSRDLGCVWLLSKRPTWTLTVLPPSTRHVLGGIDSLSHLFPDALPWGREARLQLAESSRPTALVISFPHERQSYHDTLGRKPRLLHHSKFS